MPWHKLRIRRLSLVLACITWAVLLGVTTGARSATELQQPEEDTTDPAATQPAQPSAAADAPDAPSAQVIAPSASKSAEAIDKDIVQPKTPSSRSTLKGAPLRGPRSKVAAPAEDGGAEASSADAVGTVRHDPSVLKRRIIKHTDPAAEVDAAADPNAEHIGKSAPPATRKSSRGADYVRNPLAEERGLSQSPSTNKSALLSKRRAAAQRPADEEIPIAEESAAASPSGKQVRAASKAARGTDAPRELDETDATTGAGISAKSGVKSAASSAASGKETPAAPVRRQAKAAGKSSTGLKGINPLESDGSPAANEAISPAKSSGLAIKKSQEVTAAPAVTAEAASFNGVMPGKATLEELTQRWGPGVEIRRSKNMIERQYSVKPFKQIRVTVQNEKVASIVVQFDKPIAAQPLAKQLQIDDVQAIDVADDSGQPLGKSFPERGVMFNYADGTTNVAHVILEPISAEPFLIRAESRLYSAPRRAAADLDYVIQIDPNNDRAHYLLARVLQDHGHAQDALQHIEAAVKRRPANAAYQLLLAKTQGDLGRYDDSMTLAKKLASSQVPGEIKAAALCQCGSLLAFGPAHDCKQALEFHQTAIKIAEPLANSSKLYVRRAAKEALIDANLGVAVDVAGGHYQQKERVVPMWLDRAKAHVADQATHDSVDAFFNLRVCRYALAASLMTSGKFDPVPWTASAQKFAKQLLDETNDPWRRQRIQWECGLALYNAWQIEVSKGQPDTILSTGQMVVSYLEEGNKERQETAADSYRLGRLYFRMGAVYAVRRGDHVAAITWFDKAVPMLERPLPPLSAREEGHHGETFVSMGISYWESGQKERALKVTQHGVDLMTAAVDEKKLDERSMSVPFSNLATMFRQLGQEDESKRYVDLSDKSKVRR